MKKARKVLRTKLCNLLGIDYPIMLAGMGIYQGDPLLAYSRAEPVAAVANADGMGITGRTRFLPEELRDEIR